MGGAITGFVVGGLTSNVCFVAGTVVSTECGKKVIENIKKGELVWAQDENTGEKMLKKVLRTFINETNELVYVEVNGEIITSTSLFCCRERMGLCRCFRDWRQSILKKWMYRKNPVCEEQENRESC